MTPKRSIAMWAATAALLATTLPSQPVLAMNLSRAGAGGSTTSILLSSEQALIDQTNSDRVANGVAPLVFDPDTVEIARQRAHTQLGPQNLDHYDASGQLIFSQLLGQAHLPYGLAGENLARASSVDDSLVPRIEQALMQSPTHRKNILETAFKRVSIGAATDSATGQIAFAEIYRD
jgi:uncharacterized protein YkwD